MAWMHLFSAHCDLHGRRADPGYMTSEMDIWLQRHAINVYVYDKISTEQLRYV